MVSSVNPVSQTIPLPSTTNQVQQVVSDEQLVDHLINKKMSIFRKEKINRSQLISLFKKQSLVQTISYKNEFDLHEKEPVSNTHLFETFYSKTCFQTEAKSHTAVPHLSKCHFKEKNVGNIASFILLYKKGDVTRLNHEQLIYIIILRLSVLFPIPVVFLCTYLISLTISVDNVKKLLISSSCVGVETSPSYTVLLTAGLLA